MKNHATLLSHRVYEDYYAYDEEYEDEYYEEEEYEDDNVGP